MTPAQYRILREKGTELAFTGDYWDEKRRGMYQCAACGNKLFSSDTKFDSGTGWPSFDAALPGAVVFREDRAHGMVRTEVTCARCGSHLGHVFDDLPRHGSGKAGGPQESTGKRFCINSACLRMKSDEELKDLK